MKYIDIDVAVELIAKRVWFHSDSSFEEIKIAWRRELMKHAVKEDLKFALPKCRTCGREIRPWSECDYCAVIENDRGKD
jgi:hypothetical protein